MRTDSLLARLRAADGPLSGSALADSLGVTRAAVHKRIEKLRVSGHRISGTHRVGYRWSGSTGRLDASVLQGPLARDVIHRRVLASTQDTAKAGAVRGAAEGTLVIADRQTAGRGRMGRRWSSPAGGLWFSLVLRPAVRPDRVPPLPLVAALSWVEVLRARGVPAGVKWPNDVWADGKKIAGFLTEMSAETDRVQWVVLGAGVNVNNRPPSSLPGGLPVPAGAVAQWTGPVVLEELLGDWLSRFSRSYSRFVRAGFSPFRPAFERWSVLQGERVFFEGPSGRCEGRVIGIDREGRLRLTSARGETTCGAGEVSLIRPEQRHGRPRSFP
ncbi:MAG: biotin--[acetyl-CoA-carboxylase] ligase [Elusimicrobia bacterium]|nr:biotin--[acetyl-CoA-carboxylase] ligase [Elusimicrobiota bacterium]